LNVLFSNVDTLSNKCSELEATLSVENEHVIGLCEIYPKNCFDKSVASKLDLNCINVKFVLLGPREESPSMAPQLLSLEELLNFCLECLS
jgi:hypothetical protein